MPSMLQMLTSRLGDDSTRRISQQLGADEAMTAEAIAVAVPLLLVALARNASTSRGAEALWNAVAKDHDGSILDASGWLERGSTSAGDSILGHALGEKCDVVQQALGEQTGLDAGTIRSLLSMLAPLVMGAVGRAQRVDGLNANSLTSTLASEEKVVSESLGSLALLLEAGRNDEIT